jgi:uncharacterized membrane protein YhaH (DUF805 family)
MGEAVANVFKNYANFKGRARRSEYWWFLVFNSLVSIFLNCIIQPIANSNPDSMFLLGLALILYLAYLGGMIIPAWAVTVRRLHDIGKSGWWWLIALIPIVGSLVLLVWSCQDSDVCENKYGSSPKY